MKENLTDEQTAEILKALNKAIKEGPWDKSNFLRIIGKNLSIIRDSFLARLHASSKQLSSQPYQANKMFLQNNQQEVFISLYSFEGSNLQNWERIVANLPRQSISRPIYANEDHVIEVLKSKENKNNEAYVAIFIEKSNILPLAPDKVLKDKLGTPLLTLKDKSLNLDNLSRFVHITGTYQYTKGRLIKMP